MARDAPVERIEGAVGDVPQHTSCRSGKTQCPEELDATCPVPRERTVIEREMPTREALVLGERLEEWRRLLVVHREQRELLSPVEHDDDPRRPAAEASARVVKEHRAATLLYGPVASSNPSSTARTRVPISSRS